MHKLQTWSTIWETSDYTIKQGWYLCWARCGIKQINFSNLISNHTKTPLPSKTHRNTGLLFRYEGQRRESNSLKCMHKLLLLRSWQTASGALSFVWHDFVQSACAHNMYQAFFGPGYEAKWWVVTKTWNRMERERTESTVIFPLLTKMLWLG